MTRTGTFVQSGGAVRVVGDAAAFPESRRRSDFAMPRFDKALIEAGSVSRQYLPACEVRGDAVLDFQLRTDSDSQR